MPNKRCSVCGKKTPSLISTPEGDVCLSCYMKKSSKTSKRHSHEEADIQSEFFDKVKLFFPQIPDKLLFAVPNGGSRNKIEAKNMKRQGVKAGVSDVILLIPRNGYASLCMEFKTKIGTQSKDQKEFQKQAEANGSKYVIVRNTGGAFKEIKEYLS